VAWSEVPHLRVERNRIRAWRAGFRCPRGDVFDDLVDGIEADAK